MREIKFRAWDSASKNMHEDKDAKNYLADGCNFSEVIGNIYENPELIKN